MELKMVGACVQALAQDVALGTGRRIRMQCWPYEQLSLNGINMATGRPPGSYLLRLTWNARDSQGKYEDEETKLGIDAYASDFSDINEMNFLRQELIGGVLRTQAKFGPKSVG